MTEEEHFLTPEGAEALKAELAELTGVKREELAKRLRHAVSQGDLTENADYIVAKEEQAFLEGRIQELEFLLRDATIIDSYGDTDIVRMGSTLVVREEGNSESQSYRIVGVKEAKPSDGKISHKSPIGQALLGLGVGDKAWIETPGGTLTLVIEELR